MSDLILPDDMLEDLHEDLTNLYIKYYDRYRDSAKHDIDCKATVICSMTDVIQDMNVKLAFHTVDDLLKKINKRRNQD